MKIESVIEVRSNILVVFFTKFLEIAFSDNVEAVLILLHDRLSLFKVHLKSI